MFRFNNQVVSQRRMRPRTIARAGIDLQWNRVSDCAENVRDRPVKWLFRYSAAPGRFSKNCHNFGELQLGPPQAVWR